MNPLFADSLDHAIEACSDPLLEPLRGARLLVTGCTGFFGGWVLRAIVKLNLRGIPIKAQCLSRNPLRFLERNPDIASMPELSWLKVDSNRFNGESVNTSITHILHMAASSDARDYAVDPLAMVDTILEGTRSCISLARRTGAHLHFVSSGAVYGTRTQADGPCREDQIARFATDPAKVEQSYGSAKRMAEAMLASGWADHSISRPFAFLGPLLPLDQHFAAGNFIADAVAGRPIRVKGDGTQLRSYMHPADLAVWLLVLMAQARHGEAVNVGSGVAVSIHQLAQLVCSVSNTPEPIVEMKSTRSDALAYWPDVSRAQGYGLRTSSTLPEAIEHSLKWARALV